MSGSELPPLRPLAASPVALSNCDSDPPPDLRIAAVEAEADLSTDAAAETPAEVTLPWEMGEQAEAVEAELRKFCRVGELVYAAVINPQGLVDFSVCTVGSRPHNEAQIGELVSSVFATARALGGEVGERDPQGLNLQGARWSYSLDPLGEGRLLFGIFSSKALPAIVRACGQRARVALSITLNANK